MTDRGQRPLRLLAYSDSAIYSGAEAMLCQAVRGLASAPGMVVRCAAPKSNPRLFEELRESSGVAPADVPAQPLPVAAVHLHDPRRRAAISRMLHREGPDVLLVNLPSAEYGATPLLTRGRWTSVGFLHVAGSPKDLRFRLGWARERIARHALRNLDAVCVIAPSAAKAYSAMWNGHGTEVRTVRLPRPQIEPVEKSKAREELDLPKGRILGIAGRISFKQKGHDTLVEAAEILAERGVDVSYAVAGEGRDKPRLEHALASRGLSERFHLLGHVQPIELFLSALDAIVIPSRFEGMPLVALEALALGVPGVAAATDGLKDIWPRRWQVPAGNAAALASMLEELLDTSAEVRNESIGEGRELMERCTGDDIALQLAAAVEATNWGTSK